MDICFAVGKYTNYGLGVEFDTMRYFKDQKQAIEYFNTVCAQNPDKFALYTIKDGYIKTLSRYVYVNEEVDIGPITPICGSIN